MGVYISKTAYSPLAIVSAAIGFISFAFTLGTFFKVLWTNFETIGEAPHEVHGYLTNLRTELLEERQSLKAMQKQCRKDFRARRRAAAGHEEYYRVNTQVELDEVSLKTMSDMIRHLIKKFEEVEKPFLEPGDPGIKDLTKHRKRRRDSGSVSPYCEPSPYTSPEKNGARARDRSRSRLPRYAQDVDDDAEKYWAQRTSYANFSLRKRWYWLFKKPEAQDLMQALTRAQTRRMARQVSALTILIHEYGGPNLEMQEKVSRIDERMSRFVGVRRVDGDG
jgi:hypothetical protein